MTTLYNSYLPKTWCSGKYSKIDHSLLVHKDTVECKACHCKSNACSSQNGEDDSEGKINGHILLQGNTIIWD